MKQVSIIIVTYNSDKDIYDCVDSIMSHADIPLEDIELIIVDNCSREPEPMFARLKQQWDEEIILIENTQNGGYGQGNNVGIRRATAPVILIMNPDVRLLEPFFRKPLDAFTADKELIKDLGLKVNQLVSENKMLREARDSVIMKAVNDSVHAYHDRWVDFEYFTRQQLLKYAVRDSFVTEVARLYKHRFLFWRWGTKGYEVKIVNFNPHVDVKYNQHIMIRQ